MNHNVAIAEQICLLASIDPAAGGVAAVTSSAIDTKLHRRILILVNAGAVTSTGVLTITLTSSATTGGSYSAVSGLLAFPPIIATGNKVLYEIRTEQLASVGALEFIKVVATTTLAAVLYTVEVFGASERYLPASDYNITAVQAVVLN